jgi:hypothetical protein
MFKSIQCPNCQAPIDVDSEAPTITCSYCGAKSQNTRHLAPPPPRPQPIAVIQPHQAPKGVMVIMVVSVALAILIAGAVAFMASSKMTHVTQTFSVTTSGTSSVLSGNSMADSFGLSAAASGEVSPEEQALLQKISAFQACRQQHAAQVLQSQQRYLSWVASSETGPTCKEPHISYGVYTLSETDGCVKKINEASILTPRMGELEEAGTQFVAALQTLEPLLKKANRYFEQKDYEEDGCAKAKAMHLQLMAAWKQFLPASQIIQRILDQEQPKILRRQVARLEKQAKDLRYYYFRSLLAGMDVAEACRKSEEENSSDEELKLAVETYRQELDLLEEIADQKKESASSIFWFSAYQNCASSFLKQVKVFAKRERGTPSSDKNRRIQRQAHLKNPGRYARLQAEYQSLLSCANNVHFVHYKL